MTLADVQWVEKYRPETLDDIIGNEAVVERLRYWAENGETPNLFFEGPPGTGKTAMATAFARDLYGESWRQNFVELNASDDRGIDVVRDVIKRRAEQGPTGEFDYQLIFLDESDHLTKDSQAALRRVMEDYADRTRFILSGNYLNKIIRPIQSRCTTFHVSPLDEADLRGLLQTIAEKESLEVTDDALDVLVDISRGDARRAINGLQAANVGERITADGVESVVGVVDTAQIEEIVELAFAGEFDDAMSTLHIDLLKDGVDSFTLADEFLRVLKKADVPEDVKYKSIDSLGDIDFRILEGANPHVQWSAFLASLVVARHNGQSIYEDRHATEE